MSPDSWELPQITGSGLRFDEKSLSLHEQRDQLWHEEGGKYHQRYNEIRQSEVLKRNRDIFYRVAGFYLSKKGLVVVAISVVLALVTSSLSFEGIFFWNFLLAIIVWVFFEMTSREEVRPEWSEVWQEQKNF